jgi:prepilin-type N-terminal cleavage/methylation domain-containing protein
MKMSSKRSNGFTLVEILVALAITGLIGGAITTSIVQMFDINHQNTNSITAQRQVQQVGYNMSRDGQNAQAVDPSPGGTGLAEFTWTEWDGDLIIVTYNLSGGIISRTESVNGVAGAPRQIATDINAADTLLSDTVDGDGNVLSAAGDGTWHLTVTASFGGKLPVSETRVYEIRQRTL